MKTNTYYDACIIGGGISGLSVAYGLHKAGKSVAVLERSSAVGGAIQTSFEKNFLVDTGPNSTLAKSEAMERYIKELGLEDERCFANEKANSRYILKGGVIKKMPMSPPAFLKTDLLSWRGKLRVAREFFISAPKDDRRESLAEFVERRLGREFLDYFINPFVSGVYAGRPEDLDVRAAFKKVWELEQNHGGLLRGAIALQRSGKKSQDPSKGKLFSFKGGMQVLPAALSQAIGNDRIFCECTLEKLENAQSGYTLHANAHGRDETFACKNVVFATPADVTGSLLESFSPDATRIKSIPYASVAVVYLGLRTEDVGRTLDGFGYLIPEKEQREILGCIWNSTLFPHRAADDHVALTAFVGGTRKPEHVAREDGQLVDLAFDELKETLQLKNRPVFQKVKKWQPAIPQYTMSHYQVEEIMETIERDNPGLYITGNFRNGVSVADCVENGYNLSRKITENEGSGK